MSPVRFADRRAYKSGTRGHKSISDNSTIWHLRFAIPIAWKKSDRKMDFGPTGEMEKNLPIWAIIPPCCGGAKSSLRSSFPIVFRPEGLYQTIRFTMLLCTHFIWIQKGFTAEPLRNDSGANFSGMIRIQARKSEIQAESRSYRPKVGDTAQNPNRIAQKRAPNGF